ncbi:MAG: hypothetical protein WCL37_06905 [Chrysiogenales bacterium]
MDPDEWANAVNGIYYSPSGSLIKFTPQEGYSFYMTGVDGKELVLKSTTNWSMWYSLTEKKWYYHKVDSKNEIDISTLRVEKTKIK